MPTRTAQAQDKARERFYGDLSEEEQTRRGQAIAETMALEIDEEHPDRFYTGYGAKTALGLFRTLQAALEGRI